MLKQGLKVGRVSRLMVVGLVVLDLMLGARPMVRVCLWMVLRRCDGCAGQENDRHTTGAVCGGSFPARCWNKA